MANLEKFKGKLSLTSENVKTIDDFETIEVCTTYSGKTFKEIMKNSTRSVTDKDGTIRSEFDPNEYNFSLICKLVTFDGKKLKRSEVESLDSNFISDLVSLFSKEEEISGNAEQPEEQ